MKSRRQRLVLCVAILPMMCFLLGCFTMGKEFQEDSVRAIQQGKTSKNNVLNMFGAPGSKGIENGEETWTYSHYQFRLLSFETWAKDLTIRFDKAGIVNSYSYSSSWPPTR
ncbi:MAG TPA: outer membrane protein assembly factor BamE [bacterium]|nr:outer membrane protein assembly factor BamE [bacterium]